MNNELTPATDVADLGIPTEPGTLDVALEMIQVGGPVVLILIAFSIFALTIVLLKAWQFGAARVFDLKQPRRLLALYRTGKELEALTIASRSRNPVAKVLAQAIRGRRRAVPEGKVREEVVRYGSELLESLRSWLRPLEVIGSMAPLLGLFGTVLGMIGAFQALEQAGNKVDPSILSGGIWEALLTTAVGLAVAMPVVAILSFFERVVERVAHDMDSVVTQIFTEDLSETAEEATGHERARLRTAVAAGE
ncbi:MAG: MotA/TolQ/ExbB proton channel family protein [Rhodospirillaceae bacterium]